MALMFLTQTGQCIAKIESLSILFCFNFKSLVLRTIVAGHDILFAGDLIMPWCTCAAEAYGSCSVSLYLCVCMSVTRVVAPLDNCRVW